MKGKLYILSTGPGGTHGITGDALNAINDSEIIVGYEPYLEEIKELIKDKTIIKAGMTEEIKRCNDAIDHTLSGKTVSLVSNGDVNVFGLASLAIELIDEQNYWEQIEIYSIPGVTSFFSAASKAGAPISQDFCAISLSDRLTPIEVIDKRIQHAVEGDFIIGVYNPKSSRRTEPYGIFLNRLKDHLDRPVLIASHLDRDDQQITFLTTQDLINLGTETDKVHMSSILIIGNSSTRWTKNNKMLTPRGYLDKYNLDGKKIKKNKD